MKKGTGSPLGGRESLRLEFKRAAVLKDPFDLARTLVAMLNASGGEVWVGVAEKDGVAVALEGIESIERERIRLRDYLAETLEPDADGIAIEPRTFPEGGPVFQLTVEPKAARRPYAALRKGMRYFGIRAGDRVRPMTRDEILGAPRSGRSTSKPASTALNARRERVLGSSSSLFWIALQHEDESTDWNDLDRFRELLTEPARSGNRRGGWSFRLPLAQPRREKTSLVLGSPAGKCTWIHTDGGLESQVLLRDLEHSPEPTHDLHPLALLEYAVSYFRLARAIFEAAGVTDGHVLLDFALTRTSGWKLPAFPPGTYGHVFEHEGPHPLQDVVLPRPMRIEARSVIQAPDRLGFDIVKRIYAWHDLSEDRIPAQYDRAAERLSLTD